MELPLKKYEEAKEILQEARSEYVECIVQKIYASFPGGTSTDFRSYTLSELELLPYEPEIDYAVRKRVDRLIEQQEFKMPI